MGLPWPRAPKFLPTLLEFPRALEPEDLERFRFVFASFLKLQVETADLALMGVGKGNIKDHLHFRESLGLEDLAAWGPSLGTCS